MSKKSPYGKCPICEREVVIPGLCGYKCISCGWIKQFEIALLLKKQAKKIATKQEVGSHEP